MSVNHISRLVSRLEQDRDLFSPGQGERKASLNQQLLNAWIFHDLLLEGEGVQRDEIQAALVRRDKEYPVYLHVLFDRIRQYRAAIEQVWSWSGRGVIALNLQQVFALHRQLMTHNPDAGARFRKSSPVHRDYHQPICSPAGLKEALKTCLAEARRGVQETSNPLAFAAQFHHQLMFLYPFRERPGCLARLLTNLLLLAQGYPPLILISANRHRYYTALAATDSTQLTQLFNETMRGFLDLKVPLTEQEAQRLKWSV